MTTIPDAYMREMLGTIRPYSLVFFKAGPNRHAPDAAQLLAAHDLRVAAFLAEGTFAIVCTIADGSEMLGICLTGASLDDVRTLLDADPAVQAQVCCYELHPCRSFPGDQLPA